MKRFNLGLFAAGLCLSLAGAYVLAVPLAGYHLLKKIPFGAAPGGLEYFDYITFDASTRRVYLSHGTEVKVLDADSSAVVGTVSGLKRDHGVVVLNDLGRGFITDGGSGQVVMFDLKTLKTIGQIKAGGDPDSILYDPASKRIFVFNGGTKDSTVIDPAKGTVVATIPLGGAPEHHCSRFTHAQDHGAVASRTGWTARIDGDGPAAPPAVYRRAQPQAVRGYECGQWEDHRSTVSDRRPCGHQYLRP